MKFSKAFKRLNPAPLLRGSCVRSQNAVADGEEVAALKCPETALMVLNPLLKKSSMKSIPDASASKTKLGNLPGVKTVAKRLFGSNRRANDGNIPVALATHFTPHWRFWRRKNAANTLINDINPVPGTPQPPAAGSPAAAAAALNLPYPLPISTAPVDLSPLATGMQVTGNAASSEDFVIRAFPGNQQHQACTPHPATGTMLIRPFSAPASTSPRFEVLSVGVPGSGISHREITMNDVRDELDKIFAQLPAAKASPTKAAATLKDDNTDRNNASPAAALSKSAVKKALMMTPPTSDAAAQTDLSHADKVDDGKANYAWGNSGHTMRLSATAAAKLGMHVVVSEVDTAAESARQQEAVVNSGKIATAPVPEDDKITVAWGNKGHTMRLSRAAAAKFRMKIIVPEAEVDSPAASVFNASAIPTLVGTASAVKSPLSSAISVGPIKGAPTPACSPAGSLVSSLSPCITPSNASNTSTAKIGGNKRPPPIRTSTFDVAAVMLKLANNGMTPPPSTNAAGKSFFDMSLKELVSTPLSELYPGLYGPDDELLSPYKTLVNSNV
ncbi:hypothetical protein Ndes2437B_g04999 [Nannochloris sp. 'desiccata']